MGGGLMANVIERLKERAAGGGGVANDGVGVLMSNGKLGHYGPFVVAGVLLLLIFVMCGCCCCGGGVFGLGVTGGIAAKGMKRKQRRRSTSKKAY
ncbi:hypothetical protein DM860_008281 [Cuscuta australis]|uniref:Transmembrane protein n=1 Tax=Cuscuta australis TaxID=267555 RepID=A0A328D741_9ASTE|nr:hypothetical protein DM860_008281 [Cuscuta australis]